MQAVYLAQSYFVLTPTNFSDQTTDKHCRDLIRVVFEQIAESISVRLVENLLTDTGT
jgi:hypothetical protein